MNDTGNGKLETFADLYAAFLQRASTRRLEENTLKLYSQTVKKFCDWADAESITPKSLTSLNVLAYIGGLKRLDGRPYAVNTIRAHARDLKTMLTFAFEYGIIPRPIKVETPSLPPVKIEYLSDEEQARVIEHAESLGKPREAAVVHLLLDTGLRSNEFTSLIWKQVSWSENDNTGTIKDVEGKGGKVRTVHFGARSWHYLQAIKREWPGVMIPGNHSPSEAFKAGLLTPSAPVFCRDRPVSFRRLGNRGLALILATMGSELNLHLHPHKFRHSAIRNWVRAGMPLQAIMQLSGHSSLRMIEHYSRLENDDVQTLYAAVVNGTG
jgi:integrase/recombinase XerD